MTRLSKKVNRKNRNNIRIQAIKNEIKTTPMDNMTGVQFEYFLKGLFKDLGYNVRKTPDTGDFGVDLILDSKSGRSIVQAKRYSNKVGVRAVQEVTAAKQYYNADNKVVITNSFFTDPAKELANINNVILIDRIKLNNLILNRDNPIINDNNSQQDNSKSVGINQGLSRVRRIKETLSLTNPPQDKRNINNRKRTKQQRVSLKEKIRFKTEKLKNKSKE